MTFSETAPSYLDDPTGERLDALRSDITAASNYDCLIDLNTVTRTALAEHDPQRAIQDLMGLMPAVFLSPTAHALLAQAYTQLSDERGASRERALAKASLDSILGTGDGSAARPWSVLLVQDEYDVLAERGLVSRRQELLRQDGRSFDRHELTDGSFMWFELPDDAVGEAPD